MDIIQLLITAGAVVGIIVIGLLAIVPSLLDYPRGLDKDEPDMPAPTPLHHRRRRHSHHHGSGMAA
jgi:hypothetical protein